jgi:hypothetical protein
MLMRFAAAKADPASPIPGTDDSGDRAAFFNVIDYFRETNAEGLRIRKRLENATGLVEPDGHRGATHAFNEARHVIREEIAEAGRRAALVEEFRKANPEEHAWYARELVQVTDAWDDLSRLWPTAHEKDESLSKLTARAKDTIQVLDNMIFICALQSIPNELENYLKNYRIGKTLDFVDTFKDQLPDEATTKAVLARLAPQSGIVSGVIDLEQAKIIKADQRWWRQVLSVVWIVLMAGFGFGLAAIAVHMGAWFHFKPSDWPVNKDQWAELNGAYVLVLLGVLGHWVLDRVKQNRAGTDVTPFSEWLMWIHINEVPITIRIGTVWLVVMLGVAFKAFDLAKGVVPATYFPAGYFMDSTFDALIGRFNTFIGDKDPSKKKP